MSRGFRLLPLALLFLTTFFLSGQHFLLENQDVGVETSTWGAAQGSSLTEDEPVELLKQVTPLPQLKALRITLRGPEISFPESQRLYAQLTAAIDKHRPEHLLLDCAEVHKLDSTSVGALTRCHTELNERGGTLTICGLQPTTQITLASMNLDRVLNLTETPADQIINQQQAAGS